MALRDKVAFWIASSNYKLGTLLAHMLIAQLGRGCQIHPSVHFLSPSHIKIGDRCEIREGCSLDARSGEGMSISIGSGSRIKDHVVFTAYGGKIIVGRNVLIGRCSTIFGHGGVSIGDNSMISPSSVIVSSNHLSILDGTPFQDQGFTREPISIGENVWLGAHVCVLAGSRIGANAVVAAGSTVRGDLAGGWVYGGLPAKPIRRLDSSRPDNITVYERNWGLLD